MPIKSFKFKIKTVMLLVLQTWREVLSIDGLLVVDVEAKWLEGAVFNLQD